MHLRFLLPAALLLAPTAGLADPPMRRANAAEPVAWPRYHGPALDNIAKETGLLKSWPKDGPKLLWTAHGLGQGYVGVVAGGGMLYTAGDVGDSLRLLALDLDGRVLWSVDQGKAWSQSGPAGARSTPTLDGDRLYHENGHDDVFCRDAKTGQAIWRINLAEQFGGARDGFGRAESLWIDGDRVICCPGGKTAVAALDKRTGRTVWKSPSADEPASYVSPVVVQCRGLRLVLTMSSRSFIGVNADTGELLWRFEHYTPRYVANCVNPIYRDGRVFISGGYGLGSVLLEIQVDGTKASVRPVWRSKDLDNRHGGVVLCDGFLYGASHFNNNAKWICLEWNTGRMQWADRGVGEGSSTLADGMLYTLNERRTVGLVRPAPTRYQLVSQFKLPEGGDGPTWAHPVVCGGRLYLRHGERLYAYDVRAGK